MASRRKRIVIESVILGALALTFASVLIVRPMLSKSDSLYAHVYVHQQLNKEFDLSSLSEEGEYYTVTISSSEYLKIHAKHGSIAVKESTCPGQDCVRQGYIHLSNEVIVCAHYGVYIALEGTASNVVIIG